MNNLIIFNRMYAGNYLEENLGHETINLFQSDNGNYYVYLNKNGILNTKIHPVENITAVLMVRYYCPNTFEILAKAEGLSLDENKIVVEDNETTRNLQLKYIKDNDIKYGGVFLNKLYSQNPEDTAQKVYITFKAEKITKPKQPIYIYTKENPKVILEGAKFKIKIDNFARQSLRQFIFSEKSNDAYAELKDIVTNENLWDEKASMVSSFEKSKHQRSFLQIIGKEYDELAYSNFFAYIFRANPEAFCTFAKEILHLKISSNIKVSREYKNIDLLIHDKKNTIVIENKIRSGINGCQKKAVSEEEFSSQLNKYVEEIEKDARFSKKKHYFFIFTPDYNQPNMEKYKEGDKYKVITYSELYKWFSKNEHEYIDKSISYYEEFLAALGIHKEPVDNFQERELFERFSNVIQ